MAISAKSFRSQTKKKTKQAKKAVKNVVGAAAETGKGIKETVEDFGKGAKTGLEDIGKKTKENVEGALEQIRGLISPSGGLPTIGGSSADFKQISQEDILPSGTIENLQSLAPVPSGPGDIQQFNAQPVQTQGQGVQGLQDVAANLPTLDFGGQQLPQINRDEIPTLPTPGINSSDLRTGIEFAIQSDLSAAGQPVTLTASEEQFITEETQRFRDAESARGFVESRKSLEQEQREIGRLKQQIFDRRQELNENRRFQAIESGLNLLSQDTQRELGIRDQDIQQRSQNITRELGLNSQELDKAALSIGMTKSAAEFALATAGLNVDINGQILTEQARQDNLALANRDFSFQVFTDSADRETADLARQFAEQGIQFNQAIGLAKFLSDSNLSVADLNLRTTELQERTRLTELGIEAGLQAAESQARADLFSGILNTAVTGAGTFALLRK